MKKIISLALLFFLAFAPISRANETANPILLQLKQRLAEAQYRYYNFKNNIKFAQSSIEEYEKEIETLEGAVKNLDRLILDSERKIKSVKSQIEEKKIELESAVSEMKRKNLEIEKQKEIVADLITLLYVKKETFYDEGIVNAVKVLSNDSDVSETLQKVTYLDLMESENQNQIQKLADMQSTLRDTWQKIQIKQSQLNDLDREFAGEKKNLEMEKIGKENLLAETKGDEAIYKLMLSTSDEKENEILKEIEIYQKNIDSMQDKLSGNGLQLSEEEEKIIEEIQFESLEQFSGEEAAKQLNFDWPVPVKDGLTAFFHDGGYQALFGVDHYALDIRAVHGSPIYAPADGVVFNVVFDPSSTSYAYIMLAHRSGVMTLYGHISQPNVSAGDFVRRGDVIGLTGATPHTIGAGYRTTGPHLHFEVWQDGVRVDPLKYLRLEEVPMDSLPEEYLEMVQSRLEDKIREIQSQLQK